jgi:hypothetical protein
MVKKPRTTQVQETRQRNFFRDILQSIQNYTYRPVSLKQHYELTRKITLGINGLSHLTSRTQIQHKDFHDIWKQANPSLKELLIFMWHMGDLYIEDGVIETISAAPVCYVIRYTSYKLYY